MPESGKLCGLHADKHFSQQYHLGILTYITMAASVVFIGAAPGLIIGLFMPTNLDIATGWKALSILGTTTVCLVIDAAVTAMTILSLTHHVITVGTKLLPPRGWQIKAATQKAGRPIVLVLWTLGGLFGIFAVTAGAISIAERGSDPLSPMMSGGAGLGMVICIISAMIFRRGLQKELAISQQILSEQWPTWDKTGSQSQPRSHSQLPPARVVMRFMAIASASVATIMFTWPLFGVLALAAIFVLTLTVLLKNQAKATA